MHLQRRRSSRAGKGPGFSVPHFHLLHSSTSTQRHSQSQSGPGRLWWTWTAMNPNTHTHSRGPRREHQAPAQHPPSPAGPVLDAAAGGTRGVFFCVDSGLSSGPSFFLPAVKNYNFSSPMNVCVLSVPARASMSIGHDDASKTKGHHSSSSRSRRSEENPMRCGGSCDGA